MFYFYVFISSNTYQRLLTQIFRSLLTHNYSRGRIHSKIIRSIIIIRDTHRELRALEMYWQRQQLMKQRRHVLQKKER